LAGEGTTSWYGKSGREYKYDIYQIGTTFDPVPGNYVFARYEAGLLEYIPIYVGQTEDLSELTGNHPKMPCIQRNRASCLCIHRSSSSEKNRTSEEADLVARLHPACNI